MLSLLLILSTPNCSYLSNTVYRSDLNDHYNVQNLVGGEKQSAILRQNYEDRIRNYNQLDNSFENQQSYYQNFSGRSQSFQDLYSAFRKTQSAPYIQNVRSANRNGDISQPVQYVSIVGSGLTGNPIKTNIGTLNLEQQLNVTNSTASFEVNEGPTKARVELNATSSRDPYSAWVNNTEFAKVRVDSPLFLGTSGGFTYGGTSGFAQASLSHPIINHVVGVVDKSWDGNSLIVSQVSGKLGYQLNF